MLNRVAVLSDIHGALPALEAVLAEPDVAAADLIVPPATSRPARSRSRCWTCWPAWATGPAGSAATPTGSWSRRGPGSPSAIDVSNWAGGQLRDDQVARLAALPPTVTLEVAGLGPVLFCHATPRDDEEVVLVDSRMARWAEVLADVARRGRARWSAGTPTCRSPGWSTAGWCQPGQHRHAVRRPRRVLGAARARA